MIEKWTKVNPMKRECPACGAKPGEPCAPRSPAKFMRTRYHQERHYVVERES